MRTVTAIKKSTVQWEAALLAAMREDDWSLSRRVGKNALQAIALDLPDPKTYARNLTSEFAKALTSASLRSQCYHVNGSVAAKLRPYGLVEYGGNCLTAFGIKVRSGLAGG